TRGIAYLHLIEPRATAEQLGQSIAGIPESTATLFRQAFKGPLIAAGGFDRESAASAIERGRADAVAFGRDFISNPDLPRRLMLGAKLNPYDRSTFYGGGAAGYTDYPALEKSEVPKGTERGRYEEYESDNCPLYIREWIRRERAAT